MKLFARRQKSSVRRPKTIVDDQGYVFRRSRTLTGTTSPRVTAGAQARSQLKTVRLQAHELHQLRNRIVRILVVLIVCIALLGYMVASYITTVRLRYVQPGGRPNTTLYQQTILGYFARHPLERFNFSLNQKQFTAEIKASHPEISSIDIDGGLFGDSDFIVAFRKPLLVWQSSGHTFYVDNQGVAFPYDHFGGKYVAVNDQSGISSVAAGGAVTSNSFINFLGKMVGAVDAGGRGTVTDVIIPASTREVDLKLQGRGYPIKTHTDRDPLQQAQDIINGLKWFDDHKVTPVYIDVRVAGKVYFK